MRLILASASPRRLLLLSQIGITPDAVMAAEVDERPARDELPRRHAERLARDKARTVAEAAGLDVSRLSSEGRGPSPLAVDSAAVDATGTLVLAADTVVSVGRRILGKPSDEAGARASLELLSGRRHRVHTAVCLIANDHVRERLVETRVQVKRLSDLELTAYLRSGEWRGKAGGYAIQGIAAAFIPAILGSYTNVVGLPLTETVGLLTGAGYRVSYAGAPA